MKLRLTLPLNVDTNNEQDDQFEQQRAGTDGEKGTKVGDEV